MSIEACTLALRNALNQIKDVCPDITNTFVFRENGEIIAEDQNTTQVSVSNLQEAVRALTEKADIIGRIESITFKGEKVRAKITRFNDFYVASVASNEADEKTVTNLTRVMIPTMLKLVQEIYPSSQNHPQRHAYKTEPEPETYASPEPQLPEAQTSQYTVENLGFSNFLSDPDLVRIDSALIAQWIELYGKRHIAEIIIEDPETGKTMRCGFKPFKDSKLEGKGIILMPEKIQLALGVQKGAQVTIKPEMGNHDSNANMYESEPTNKETNSLPETAMFSQSESYTPDAPVSQLLVENLRGIGGFFGNPDFVRVDRAIIAQWKELFGDKEIKEVIIQEIITGKKVRCKFQPIKDSNLEGKGVVQLPEKTQQALLTKKGALVVVKPVVE